MGYGQFVQLDPPADPIVNSPPPLPQFFDGQVVHQADLGALVANVEYLQQFVLGGSQGGVAKKPLTVLRAISATALFQAGAATPILWDTADVDTVGAWNQAKDPYTIVCQKEGYYRIYFQCTSDATSAEQVTMLILVNGTDVADNQVTGCAFHGLTGNLEVTVPLAKTASIQVVYQTLTTHHYARTYGGVRIEVEWLAPTIPNISSSNQI